ncbi:MAG: inositol monophosphatase family protein [Miltoncostaeaceae bacterium]
MRGSGDDPLWLGACRRACRRIAGELAGLDPAARRERLGAGAGGDTTLRVDRMAEDIVIAELADTGLPFLLISEEAGERPVNGGGPTVVVVDPIDGSLNAGRGMTPFSTSIAVASGRTMADVTLGLVHDHGTGEEFLALRGAGAAVDGLPVRPPVSTGLELVAVEGALPRRIAHAAGVFEGRVGRFRAVGSLALSLCYAAAGRCDAMVGLGPGRPVDVAAAQLFALEAGMLVGMPGQEDLAGSPLDVTTHRHIVAARDEPALALMRAALPPAGARG